MDTLDDLKRKHRNSHHHIIPRSRKGTDKASNIAIVKQHHHDKYHSLFQNKTPEEILDYLVRYFWNGNMGHVKQYLRRRGYDYQTTGTKISLQKCS